MPCLRAAQAVDFAVAADTQDLVSAHRHRFRHRPGGIGGIDLAVENNEIDGAVVVVALRADHEAGDEGRGNDADDDVSGEAGGHAVSRRGPAIRAALGLVRHSSTRTRFPLESPDPRPELATADGSRPFGLTVVPSDVVLRLSLSRPHPPPSGAGKTGVLQFRK